MPTTEHLKVLLSRLLGIRTILVCSNAIGTTEFFLTIASLTREVTFG